MQSVDNAPADLLAALSRTLGASGIRSTLHLLEEALSQSDLQPLFDQELLRAERSSG